MTAPDLAADDDARDLAAAATAFAAREQVRHALGELAARPLDQRAGDLMRQALAQLDTAVVRAALRRLQLPPAGEPVLGQDQPGAPVRRLRSIPGGAR